MCNVLAILIEPSPVALNESPLGGYLKVVLLLAGLLCLGFVLLRLLPTRKFGFRRRASEFELIDRFGLEPRRTLYIVKVGASHLLLSSSENGVQFLKELAARDLSGSAGDPARREEAS
jgi:flagellar biogenesis protein FliO